MKKRKCTCGRSNRWIGIGLIALGLLALGILVLPPVAWLIGAAAALIVVGIVLLQKK